MMRSVTEEIKEKLNVVDVLKQYIEVIPAGKNFKAKCPFHGDSSPSLMISPERQSWHCFGCNVGGDIFTFVTKYENLEFFEALKVLAEKAGVKLERVSPAEHRQFGVLYDINEEAKNFFREQLEFQKETKNYLTKERGLREETIEEFELGASPSGWDELLVRLVNKGYSPEDIARAGLILKSEQRGNYFDRFRNRVMFPIMNHSGKTVGFTGRVLPWMEEKETMGKYVNSPETPIFSKSRVLYGFNKTKGIIRETKKALVVEGQMDMLSAWQDGVKNVTASSGTAFTQEHVAAISRLADEIILNFDSDEAGMLAAERAIDLVLKADLSAKILVIDGFKDAAELTKEHPGKLAKELEERAVPAMEFYFDRFLKGKGILEMKRGARNSLLKIKAIPSAVEKDFWIKSLARRTGINEEALKEEMAGLGEIRETKDAREERPAEVEMTPDIFTRRELLSQRLLSLALFQGNIEAAATFAIFMPENFKKIFEILNQGEVREKEDAETRRIVDLIHLRSGLEESEKMEEVEKQLKIEFLKKKKNDFLEEIRKLEMKEGDSLGLIEKIKEFQEVSKELNETMK